MKVARFTKKHLYHFIAIVIVFLLLTACQISHQRLELSHLTNFARFGRSIDTTGIVTVIGAYQESNSEGAAYVFRRAGNIWSIEARLVSPVPGDEQFGDSATIAGNIIAIGAPLDHQPGAVRSGSVYLYENNGTNWSHVQSLSSPLPHQPWEAYGISVSLWANILVVGAVDRDQGVAINSGTAFVYERVGGVFVLIDTLTAPTPVSNDKFGSDVEIVGDTLLISAVRSDANGQEDSGAVYVYQRSGSNFNLIQTLTASDGSEDDIFGTGLGLFLANDGSRRAVVGAEGVDAGGNNNAGAAYVFDAPAAGMFSQTEKLTASDGTHSDLFGTDVALWSNRILVGASGADDVAASSGAVYTFLLQGGAWVEEDKLFITDTVPDAFLGSAVSLWASYALLGSTGVETEAGLANNGSVEAFRFDSTNNWIHSHTLTASTDQFSSGYGKKIDLFNDNVLISSHSKTDLLTHSGDAYSLQQTFPSLESDSQIISAAIDGTTLALFGRRNPGPMVIMGYVEIFTDQGGVWTQEQLIEPDLVSASLPGESADSAVVDLEGDTLVIGARRWNGGDGRVFIYSRDNGVWSEQQVFTSPVADSNFDRNFGNHVALSADWLAVAEVPSSGLPMSATHGNVYIYQRVKGVFVEQQIISEPTPTNLDQFGRGLAMHGDLLAIYGENSSTLRVYRRNSGVYTEVWNQVVSDIPNGDVGLSITADQLAIGAPLTDYDSLTDAGEIRVFDRQPGDSYVAGSTFRAPNAETGLQLGGSVTMDDQRVIGSTVTNSPIGQRVYIFDL